MAGSKAKSAKEPCPTCDSVVYEIWFIGNHSERELLETHCNRCGWAIDAEGQTRNIGNVSAFSSERRF